MQAKPLASTYSSNVSVLYGIIKTPPCLTLTVSLHTCPPAYVAQRITKPQPNFIINPFLLHMCILIIA